MYSMFLGGEDSTACLTKNYSKGRMHTRQMQFYPQEKFPTVEDEDGRDQPVNEHLPV